MVMRSAAPDLAGSVLFAYAPQKRYYAYMGLPVGFLLPRYSVSYTVESLSLPLSPFYILIYIF